MASFNKGLISMFVFFTVFVIEGYCAMNEADLKNHINVIKAACKVKVPAVSDAQIQGLLQHIYPDDHNLKCFVLCGLESAQIMKDGKVDYDASLKMIEEHAPADVIPIVKTGLDKCRSAGDGMADPCEAAYSTLKCMCNENKGFKLQL